MAPCEDLPLDGDTVAILIKEIPEGANPELRLKIVANDTDNIGRIYAATAKKSLSKYQMMAKEKTAEKHQKRF